MSDSPQFHVGDRIMRREKHLGTVIYVVRHISFNEVEFYEEGNSGHRLVLPYGMLRHLFETKEIEFAKNGLQRACEKVCGVQSR